MQRILILGVGNTLLGDEGFGVHALRYLEENYRWPANVRLVDGGTLGLLLLAELFETDLAIILDIAQGGETPGTFYKLSPTDLEGSSTLRQSMHQTSLEDVLVSCDLAGHRPETLIYAMEPYDFNSLATSLTDDAAARLPEFCKRVRDELQNMGIISCPADSLPHL